MIAEPLRINRRYDRKRIEELLGRSGCRLSTRSAARRSFPAASGSASRSPARWRFGPEIMILDEAVSALDVSIQAQVINLSQATCSGKLGLVVSVHLPRPVGGPSHLRSRGGHVSRQDGRDRRSREQVFAAPAHPYTQALLSAVPNPSRASRDRIVLKGDLPDPIRPAERLCVSHPVFHGAGHLRARGTCARCAHRSSPSFGLSFRRRCSAKAPRLERARMRTPRPDSVNVALA